MPVSPTDFSLWARLTGNRYPSNAEEKARIAPDVHRFIQNMDKQGAVGVSNPKEKENKDNLGTKIAKGALVAGGIAAGIAAARDKRVQDIAQRAASTTKNKIDDFLVNLGRAQDVDVDIVDASGDVTPNPVQQQSNVASTQKSLPEGPDLLQRIEQKRTEMVDSFKPAVTGETFQTSGAISEDNIYGDIGDAKLRARRTFGPTIDALKEIDPGRKDLGRMGNKMLTQAQQDRDFDIAYIIGRNKGLDDTNAVRLARQTAGFDGSATVRKPTEYRELLGTLKTESPIKPRVDDLLNLVKTGPQINLPESVQEPGALVQLAAGSTPSNKVPTMGATIGGSSLTDQHATKMAVDNTLDDIRTTLKNNRTKAEELMGPRPKFPIDDPARQEEYKKLSIDNPLQYERELDESIKADMAYTDELSYIEDVLNEQAGVSPQKRAKTLVGPFQAAPITGVTSTGLKTSIQDDNLRRIAPTPEQAQAIREEPGRVSRTFDEMTGFTAPKSETISTNPLEERISRLEGKTAELRAIQENLGRAGELMSTGLDPRTTRFDSARAAGLTSKSGIKPRITNPRFQENMNLGKVQEAAIPESSGRVFFEQDSEGRVIPETVERRSERKVVRGPDTKTRSVAGGYVGMEGQSGSVIGPYGIEASDSPKADITKRPTDTGGKQSFSKRPPSANPVESFDVANQLRKIQTDQSISPEERRTRSKDFLKQKMSERGISAMGESEPLRKK